MKISACLITLNAERVLGRCLASVVSVADEIVVVDCGSVDRTCRIAEGFGARVAPHPWEGYVRQKNFAVSLASHEWILSIDADEELSPELIREIFALKQMSFKADGFFMPRVVYFQNRWIRFGDWHPDFLIRLFKKNKARFVGGAVHERLELAGTASHLRGEIFHYTYANREDHLQRMEKYSSLWAENACREGRRCAVWTPWLCAGWRLFRGFILKKGWKGGALGWQIARDCAYEVFLKYQKLRQLRRVNK
ncbi:MAG: glycosyltransferase family 2 protein [bacterium]